VVTTEKTYTRNEVEALLSQFDMSRAPVAKPIARREFTDGEREILRESYAAKATPAEFENLLAIASNLGLDPFKRQCHFVKRKQKIDDKYVDMWAVQVGIDGFRSKAEETGLYAGIDEPEFDYDDKGQLLCARVRVYRHGWERPAVGVAYFGEFAQSTSMWTKMPHNQLAKCAEAQAHRKAFPVLNGVYAPEELGSAENSDNGAKAGGRPAVMRRSTVPAARPTPAQQAPQLWQYDKLGCT
jgi:phage recombination protein Bet